MSRHAVGVFREPGAALDAARRLKEAGFDALEVLSPIPLHGIDAALGEKKSVIRRFTFFGALFGGLAGFTLAAGTAVLYLHPTGGRPIITLPPFLVITYEMTILCGILATVLGFLFSARLPVFQERLYVPEAAVDRFAVAARCHDETNLRQALDLLTAAGAERVEERQGAST